jgi:hypothetical protein
VSSVNESGGRPAGRTVTAVILAIIGILFIIAGIIYVAEPAQSLPSIIPGHLAGSTGHHPLRAAGTLVLGVIFFIGAWFALSYKPKTGTPAESKENSPAGQH